MIFGSVAQHNHFMSSLGLDPHQILAQRLRCLRRDKGLRQKDVAGAINISSRAYSNYERAYRSPDLKILTLIAGFFEVSVDYLLGMTTIKVRYPLTYQDLKANTKQQYEVLRVAEGNEAE